MMKSGKDHAAAPPSDEAFDKKYRKQLSAGAYAQFFSIRTIRLI
jgi:hypothetical protein